MPKDLLIHVGVAETCIALVSGGKLERYWQEQTIGRPGHDREPRIGDVVLGRVEKVLPSMEAAFVNIGGTRSGFLAARDAGPRSRQPAPRAFAREGDAILVQIGKEPIADKGARLTTNVAIPGRYLVLATTGEGVSVSRRIEDEAERDRLKSIVDGFTPENAGFVVRTAAIGADIEALAEDAARLQEIWRAIVAARANAKPPATLYREPGLTERVLRDEVDAGMHAIFIDDRMAADAACAYAAAAVPALGAHIEYRGGAPLFEAFDIEDAIAALSSSHVALPSGGWITIEATEAMTTIDVNSGKHIAGGSHDDVSLAVNLEAAEAIARQLALREVGGLIVVDFIHLSKAEDAARLTDTLRAAMARDRTPAEISPVSEFGLVAITRKRERDALSSRQTEACACCNGHGRRRTAASVALDVLREVERTAASAPGKPIAAFAAPDVVEWLDAHEDTIAPELARRGASQWRLVPEPARARESFAVETQA